MWVEPAWEPAATGMGMAVEAVGTRMGMGGVMALGTGAGPVGTAQEGNRDWLMWLMWLAWLVYFKF